MKHIKIISHISFLLFCIFFFSLPLGAQVTIKEKVVITPGVTNAKENVHTVQSGTNTIRFVFKYSCSGYVGGGFRVDETCCNSCIYIPFNSSSGTIDTTVTAQAKGYNASAGVYAVGHFYDTISVYLGDVLLGQRHDSCYGTSQYNQCIWFNALVHADLNTGYNFSSASSSITHGSSSSFNLSSNGTHDCSSTTVWNPVLPVTWTITQGNALGSFYKNGVKLASPLTNTKSYLDSVSFVANGRQPHAAVESVKVQATSNEITKQTSFTVACNFQLDTLFRQTDNSWKDSLYDHSQGKTIKARGCAMTSLATALSAFGFIVNPLQLNDWMSIPRADGKCYLGYIGNGDVDWPHIDLSNPFGIALTRSWNGSFKKGSNWQSKNTSLTELDSVLNTCKLVIVQVLNPTTGNQHWVLVTNTQHTIIDPSYTDRNTLSAAYNNKFWGYVAIGSK